MPQDVTVRRCIPVTTVARALADLAHSLDDERYHRAVKEAQFRDLWVDAQIDDVLTRRYSRRLCDYVVKPRIDFIWPERHLVVEVDGWEAHRTRVAFQDDRTNTNLLQLAGNVVLRYTYADVTRRARLVAAQVLYGGNFSSTQSGPSSARR